MGGPLLSDAPALGHVDFLLTKGPVGEEVVWAIWVGRLHPGGAVEHGMGITALAEQADFGMFTQTFARLCVRANNITWACTADAVTTFR